MKLPHGMVDSPDLPAPTEQEKISQQNAGYVPNSPDPQTTCQICQNFVEPDRCLIVSGVINPLGVSDIFTPKSEDGGALSTIPPPASSLPAELTG